MSKVFFSVRVYVSAWKYGDTGYDLVGTFAATSTFDTTTLTAVASNDGFYARVLP